MFDRTVAGQTLAGEAARPAGLPARSLAQAAGLWRGVAGSLPVMAALTFILQALLLVLALRGSFSPGIAIVLHLGMITGLFVWAGWLDATGVDASRAILLAIATGVVGALGPLGVLMLDRLIHRGREPDKLLDDWYERISFSTAIDPVSQLAENVAIGRTVDLGAPPPRPFLSVFEQGTLGDQQTVLGLMARDFHPDHLPALQAALGSDEPVIRVQAAAVAAHIRTRLNSELATALDHAQSGASSPSVAVRIANETRTALQSGLVDDANRTRFAQAQAMIVANVVAAIDARAAALPGGAAHLSLDGEVLDAYETHLLQAHRFAELRRLRTRQRRRMYGRFVFRRARWLGRQQSKAAAVRTAR